MFNNAINAVDESGEIFSSLYAKYSSLPTYILQEIPLVSNEEILQRFKYLFFLKLEDIDSIIKMFPKAKFYFYENKVWNWKPVLILEIWWNKKVLKHVGEWFEEEYRNISEIEKRPKAEFLDINTHRYWLFDFEWWETIDYSDIDELSHLTDIWIQMSRRLTTFDPNPWNLVVKWNDVRYVDTWLTYTNKETLLSAILSNIYHTITNIPFSDKYKKDYLDIIIQVSQIYRVKMWYMLTQEEKTLLEIQELSLDTDSAIKSAFFHILKNLSEDEADEIIMTIKKVFLLDNQLA